MQMISREKLDCILTAANFINFKKLVKYLLSLPADYENFDMSKYVNGELQGTANNNYSPVCGTSACALGHGLAAGVIPSDERLITKLFSMGGLTRDIAWTEYCDQFFITTHDSEFYYETCDIWSWCFDSAWANIDNTVEGAAKRILYMLENGIPEMIEITKDAIELYKYITVEQHELFA